RSSGWVAQALDLVGGPEPVQVQGAAVSGGLLPALGVRAARGRWIDAGDDRAGGARVVALSDAFWRRRMNADSDAIGKPLTLSGQVYTVVGVMPPEFHLPNGDAELYVPLRVA